MQVKLYLMSVSFTNDQICEDWPHIQTQKAAYMVLKWFKQKTN